MAAALLLQLKAECEAQHARAEALQAELTAKDTQIAQLTRERDEARSDLRLTEEYIDGCKAEVEANAKAVASLVEQWRARDRKLAPMCSSKWLSTCADELAQALGPSVEEKEHP